ncbi:MAG: damage-inducible protein CinA, partial [Candidatus Marinimicrobia bacterium]|nr:damage-inducible protein CinA [Candidatus Neomarinimicrobiota bacterium]
DDKPIGLYYVGIFIKGHFFSEMYQSKINDRKINREISSIAALNLLRLKIKENYE